MQNLHQPFVFINKNTLNIFVTELCLPQYEYTIFGKRYVDDRWKIKLLDSDLNIQNVKTPNELIFEGVTYEIFSECSPFIHEDILSYVATIYSKETEKIQYVLVTSILDLEKLETNGINIEGTFFSAFKKGSETYSVLGNSVVMNGVTIKDFSPYLDKVIRIMGIHESNDLLVTGEKNGEPHTLLYQMDDGIFSLTTLDNQSVIYKSSLYGKPEDGILVFVDKILTNPVSKRYKLNMSVGFNLIKI